MCGVTWFFCSESAEEIEANRAQIEAARANCAPPNVFRVRPGGSSLNPPDWGCVDPATAEAERAAAQAQREAQAEQREAEEAERLARARAAEGDVEELPRLLRLVRLDCEDYDEAPNDIRKSDIFRDHVARLRELQLEGIRGTLRELATPQGGDNVRIEVEVRRPELERGDPGSRRIETTTFRPPVLGGIPRGSDVYEQAASMTVGDCVVFDADRIEPSGFALSERSKVCDPDEFVVRFRSLRACPADP